MSADEWMATQSPVFHGSFRHDWDSGPTQHFGTRGQATERLYNVADQIKHTQGMRRSYYDPSYNVEAENYYDEPPEPEQHVGQVFARRLTEKPAVGVFTDSEANAGDVVHQLNEGYEDWEISGSLKESSKGLVNAPDYGEPAHADTAFANLAARQLGRGRPIRYRNQVEADTQFDNPPDMPFRSARGARGRSQPSWVVPRSSHTSWERDVIMDKGASPMAQAYARQRIGAGQEGAVPFPSRHVEDRGTQGQLWSGVIHAQEFPGHNAGAYMPRATHYRPNINRVQFETLDEE